MVFVVVYTHKHGCDVSVYETLQKAQDSVKDLISNRISESWDQSDVVELEACKSFDDQLSHFTDVESGTSYGEVIEIEEREVQ